MSNDEKHSVHDENLATSTDKDARPNVPDPSGPPVPVGRSDTGCGWPTTLIALLTIGGLGILLLPTLQSTGTHGATRSSKLQSEQRRLEIERAIAEEEAYQSATVVEPGEALSIDRDAADE